MLWLQALSDMDDEKVDLIFTALDDNADDELSRTEFLDIVDVLRLRFISQLEDMSPMETFFPEFHATPFWQVRPALHIAPRGVPCMAPSHESDSATSPPSPQRCAPLSAERTPRSRRR